MDYPEGNVNAVQFVDARTVLVASSTGSLKTVSLEKMETKSVANLSSAIVCMDAHQEKILTGQADGSIELSDLVATKRSSKIHLENGIKATRCQWITPELFAIGTDSSRLCLYDGRLPSLVMSLPMPASRDARKACRLTALDCNPADDNMLLVGDSDGGLRLYDRRSPVQSLWETRDPSRGTITDAKFHRSRLGLVVSSASDGSILQEATGEAIPEGMRSWKMPTQYTPVRTNCLDMMGSLAVAGLDSATILTWRM